jgi:outer membrane protein OmpA-like peptidoglycan-associated protein
MKKLIIAITVFVGFGIGIGLNAFSQEKSVREAEEVKYTSSSSDNNAGVSFRDSKPTGIKGKDKSATGNEKEEKSFKEKEGDRYTSFYSYDKAIKSYKLSKPLSLEGQRSLADGYEKFDQNIESEAIYLNIVNSGGEIIPEDYYNYAMILKSNGKYDESCKWMDKFSALKPEDLRTKDYLLNKSGYSNLTKINELYKIENLKVNTDALDFGTTYYKDKIVFASTRTSSKLFPKIYKWTRKPFWDMYVSDVDSNQLKTPVIFDKHLNCRMNDGPASFNEEGTFIAYTRNNYKDRTKDRVVELYIYFSNYIDGKWSKPKDFVLNNKGYSVGHPCLSSDGNTMYFTSDMPGGFGGADLYRIKKGEKGEWGTPENLGDKINTEGDEMFPFLNENRGLLFFSSNGHFGLGGLDIFSATLNGSEFEEVQNAGSPLNSQYNDYALILENTMSGGYFSSDRPGGKGGDDIYSLLLAEPDVRFTAYSPENITVDRRVRETFPVRNYVFFDSASTEIPVRYVLLNKDQVKDFKEDQLEVFTAKDLSGRSKRQLNVYYNVLNILGDRLGKNPEAVVRLAGSSMQGKDDGLAMAESVKKYLVDVFAIDPSRINTEGRIKPRIPSEQPGGKLELDLLREGDHRVTIWSESPAIMMEFQSGPDAPLKPVELVTLQEAPLDSYVSFNVEGANEVLTSWSMEIIDEYGVAKIFGPYTGEEVSIPGKSILGELAQGDFNARMTGITKSGKTIIKESPIHIVLWKASEREEGMRYSIIFEFNDSKAITIYEKYLTDIVTPKIPQDGTVIIHGHTDIIGEVDHNRKLSEARANEVKAIIEKALSDAGRTDVKFDVHGYGEDEVLSPFENKLPEERFYNRTVIIDIIPPKK